MSATGNESFGRGQNLDVDHNEEVDQGTTIAGDERSGIPGNTKPGVGQNGMCRGDKETEGEDTKDNALLHSMLLPLTPESLVLPLSPDSLFDFEDDHQVMQVVTSTPSTHPGNHMEPSSLNFSEEAHQPQNEGGHITELIGNGTSSIIMENDADTSSSFTEGYGCADDEMSRDVKSSQGLLEDIVNSFMAEEKDKTMQAERTPIPAVIEQQLDCNRQVISESSAAEDYVHRSPDNEGCIYAMMECSVDDGSNSTSMEVVDEDDSEPGSRGENTQDSCDDTTRGEIDRDESSDDELSDDVFEEECSNPPRKDGYINTDLNKCNASEAPCYDDMSEDDVSTISKGEDGISISTTTKEERKKSTNKDDDKQPCLAPELFVNVSHLDHLRAEACSEGSFDTNGIRHSSVEEKGAITSGKLEMDKSPKQLPSKFPSVTVPTYQKKDGGNRPYDRRQACFYCGELKAKFPRHLEKCHVDEVEVARIFNLTDKQTKLKEVERIRLKGNFNHNVKILQKGEGELIVARRPIQHRDANEYIPCIHCLAFLHEDEAWRHARVCQFNTKSSGKDDDSRDDDGDDGDDEDEDDDNDKNANGYKGHSIKIQSRIFLDAATTGRDPNSADFADLHSVIISPMRSNVVKTIIKKDTLILKLGAILLNKIGVKRQKVITQRLRLLGRFLQEFRQLRNNPFIGLSEIICGEHFDSAVKATRNLCCVSKETTMAGVSLLNTPSIGLQLGHSLKKCALIKHGIGLRTMDKDKSDEAHVFLQLFNAEWTELVSSHALQSLKEKKYNKVELIPVTADLLKLRTFLDRSIVVLEDELRKSPSENSWRRLSEGIFSIVTLFNKRRGGEVAKMVVGCFTNRPNWKENRNEDILLSLSQLEQRLLESLDMVQLPGKRYRKVHLLLKPEWVRPMELLVEKRSQCNVAGQYFFAVPGSNSYLSPWKVLNRFAKDAECTRPDLISTTRLRKYTATVTQILGLKPGELEWLGNHLGHTVEVHKDSYRLHESTIEMAKVSKVLLAIENGTAGNFQGKSLNDIHIDDINMPAQHESDDDQAGPKGDGEGKKTRKQKPLKPNKKVVKRGAETHESPDTSINSSDSKAEGGKEWRHPKRKSIKTPTYNLSDDDTRDDSTIDEDCKEESSETSTDSGNDSLVVPKLPKKVLPKPQAQKKIPSKKVWVKWSNTDIGIIQNAFKRCILNERVPRKADIEKVVENYHTLNQRSWMQIKSKVQHLIKNKMKVTSTIMEKAKQRL
ncbi:uncharacterized protein LOC135487883 [Lineus longissimus]|uniref:uncharacterized protein LOC135487883 n=1 Tax=Lineus longissimus TaxID=88925 RepID=UPI00315D0B02